MVSQKNRRRSNANRIAAFGLLFQAWKASEKRLNAAEKNLPLLGQPEGPAMIEFGAKRIFQIVDLLAQRGLFLVEGARRGADALIYDDMEKKLQLVNIHLIAGQSIPLEAISASDFHTRAPFGKGAREDSFFLWTYAGDSFPRGGKN
jgi:hypothetical protein